jgi:hypothetical protein
MGAQSSGEPAAGNLTVTPGDALSPQPGALTLTDPTFNLLPHIDLKAVAIVGPIDGDTGVWTRNEIDNMEQAVRFLESHGVIAHRFYTPDNDWEAITEAAEGAHFLLYRGHGASWNSASDVGGFVLKSGLVTPEEIVADLDLAPNAIVMLYACFSTGTAGDDGHDIGLAEAQRRVAQYAAPFLELGAAGYYANWFGDAFVHFLGSMFEGATLSESYEAFYDFNAETVTRTYHPAFPQQTMYLDKDDWHGYWEYNNAFVGMPDQTLETLFHKANLRTGVPEELASTNSILEARGVCEDSHRAAPYNASATASTSWKVARDAHCLVIPTVERTTSSTTLASTSTHFDRSAEGTDINKVTAHNTATAEDKIIAVTLKITHQRTRRIYLPLAQI